MAATGTPTPNLGLRIPQGTDPASVGDINYNSNLIDTKLGAVGNDSVQDQIDSLNGNKGNVLYITSSASGTSHILTLPNGFRGIVCGLGGSLLRQFFAIVDVTAAGSITPSNVYSGSGVTITSSANNEITITYQSAGYAYIGMLDFANRDLSTVTLT